MFNLTLAKFHHECMTSETNPRNKSLYNPFRHSSNERVFEIHGVKDFVEFEKRIKDEEERRKLPLKFARPSEKVKKHKARIVDIRSLCSFSKSSPSFRTNSFESIKKIVPNFDQFRAELVFGSFIWSRFEFVLDIKHELVLVESWTESDDIYYRNPKEDFFRTEVPLTNESFNVFRTVLIDRCAVEADAEFERREAIRRRSEVRAIIKAGLDAENVRFRKELENE